jgi:cytochrome c oxidase subunit 2
MTLALSLWPGAASQHAVQVDHLVFAFTGLLIVLTAPVFAALAYFAVKYRRGSVAERGHTRSQNNWVEAAWALLPLSAALAFFGWAAWLYLDQQRTPENAIQIAAVAKQWMWKFRHPGGQREINTLHVPANVPIHITMISQDVIHSLFLPALRIKQDVLPGRYSTLSFQADETGEYHLFCAEFCGVDHAGMGGKLILMRPDAYQRWLKQAETDMSIAAAGEPLFRSYGCSGCHSAGAAVHAPDLHGLYGAPVHLADGRTRVADENYIRDSILLPKRDVVAGYRPIMPSFAGVIPEDDLLKLVAYLKSLDDAAESKR